MNKNIKNLSTTISKGIQTCLTIAKPNTVSYNNKKYEKRSSNNIKNNKNSPFKQNKPSTIKDNKIN